MAIEIKTEWCMVPLNHRIAMPKIEEILRNLQILMTWQLALKLIRMKENPLNKIGIIITEHQVH
jgi:hypothetical protein